MSKILKVRAPFGLMDEGDTFEMAADGTEYSAIKNIESNEVDDNGTTMTSSLSSTYRISAAYAKALVEEGFLTEVSKQDRSFVNVFDEISAKLDTYKRELATLDKDMEDAPAVLKLEKETTLRNMVKLLEHLNSLKK